MDWILLGVTQDLSDELEQGVRIEDGRADDREDEVDPSTRPESSSLATPSKPSATSSPSRKYLQLSDMTSKSDG